MKTDGSREFRVSYYRLASENHGKVFNTFRLPVGRSKHFTVSDLSEIVDGVLLPQIRLLVEKQSPLLRYLNEKGNEPADRG